MAHCNLEMTEDCYGCPYYGTGDTDGCKLTIKFYKMFPNGDDEQYEQYMLSNGRVKYNYNNNGTNQIAIDSQEEPVSEDLEEVIRKYEQRLEKENPATEAYDFASAIRFGANWQKQKMLANAVNGFVLEDIEEGDGDFLLSAEYLSKEMGLKDRQKVKVIVIKED